MVAVRNPPLQAHHAATWRIELLGQLRATSGDRVIVQFGSRKIAALLARLALFPRRVHSREELIDLLWPDADLDTGRNRLRQALFALRRLLEPPGAAEVLRVDRATVQLDPLAFSCDALEFEACVQARAWSAARALWVGELLPGHYDEWIGDERARLAALADLLPDEASPGHVAGAPAEPGMRLQATESLRPDRQEVLPSYVARFFGREDDIDRLAQLLQTERLVTLLGPGGSGKTRLAAETARRLRANYAVVAFVALAECQRPDEIPGRLRAALRLPDGQGDATEQLGLYLHARPALLVLDNFEQLVATGGAQVIEQLLQGLPALQLLVSSRRVLDVEGERSFDVPPLPLPAPGADLAALAANPSVALFVDRAQGARAGFHLNARNRGDIEALCAALEGVPLAIELAASRAHALSAAEMRAQMDSQVQHRFARLARTGPRAARAPRHASLDAAIDWSWQLLDSHDRDRLAALSVFREGFCLAAAAAVWQEPGAADTLARLVADSLVRSESGNQGEMRYFLFEMVREFVAERIAADTARLLRQRHRDWCLHYAQQHAGVLPLAEVPNLHEALRSSLADGTPQHALALALATESHWERRGVPPEVRALWLTALAAVVDEPGASDGVAPVVHPARCLFARRLYEAGDPATAHALANDAVAAAGTDASLLAPALAVQLRLRWKSRVRDDDGLHEALHAALRLTDDGRQPRTRADLLNLLGEVLVLGQRDADAALPHYTDALRLFESLGETRLAWDVRMGQGICAQVQRRYDDAVAIHTAVAAAAERLDDQLLLIDAHNNITVACNHARRWDQAVVHGCHQLRLATRQFSRYMQVMALWNLAKPLARSHRPEVAAVAMAASTHEWLAHFGTLAERDRRYVARVRRLIERQLGRQATAMHWAAAEQLGLHEAVQAVLDGPGHPG